MEPGLPDELRAHGHSARRVPLQACRQQLLLPATRVQRAVEAAGASRSSPQPQLRTLTPPLVPRPSSYAPPTLLALLPHLPLHLQAPQRALLPPLCRSRSRTSRIHLAYISQVSQPHISRLMVGLKYAKTAAGTWAAAPGKPRKGSERDTQGEAAAVGGAPGCSCVIRLTVLNTSVDATHGHKFKLTSLMSGFYTGNLVGQAAQWAADYDLI